MTRLAYVNRQFVPHSSATVHVEDRGYQFSDGVYEVVTIVDGRFVDLEPHLDRLARSLGELKIAWPVSRRVLALLMRELARRNRITNGIIYLQITRGVAPRDHKFPRNVRPSLVMTTKSVAHRQLPNLKAGVKVITIPDIRWARCDIKTISLLPNCLGKQLAAEAAAYEAWQVDEDGLVTEGTSSNAWIVTTDKEVVTRAPGADILNGITRQTILQVAVANGHKYVERPFSVAEAKEAVEAFTTSATSFVTPVIRIDDTVIGHGRPGELTRALLDGYWNYIEILPD